MKNPFRNMTLVEVMIVIAITALLFWVVVPSGFFVPESKAVKALETQGFKDITITHRAVWFISWRGGDKSDRVRFTAKAVNPSNKEVEVYVFCGWPFKGATVRTP